VPKVIVNQFCLPVYLINSPIAGVIFTYTISQPCSNEQLIAILAKPINDMTLGSRIT